MQVEQIIEKLELRAAALRKKWKEATISDPGLFWYRAAAGEFDKMVAILRNELKEEEASAKVFEVAAPAVGAPYTTYILSTPVPVPHYDTRTVYDASEQIIW
jgi:hypothetical protein